MDVVFKFLTIGPHLLLAVILHEIAHGLVAEKLGDNTARKAGRITLNPLKHIDPFMTVILPGLLIMSGSPVVFGGAKPVPVNMLNLRNPRRDGALVAIAGPVTNVVLALAYALVFKTLLFLSILPTSSMVLDFFGYGIVINLVLALFNMTPVPPLDGGRIAVGLLPLPLARRWASLERYGLFIVIALLYFGVIDSVLTPVIHWSLSLLML